MDPIQAFRTFFTGENVIDGVNDKKQGVIENPIDLMELSLTDDELIHLSKRYLESKLTADLESIRKDNLDYWKGKPTVVNTLWADGNAAMADNVIFEAVETLLPLITRKNPEPIVSSLDQSEGAQKLADTLRKMLIERADSLRLKLIGKKTARHWMISRVGVIKFSWDAIINDFTLCSINPKKLIFDKNGIIDDALNYTGEFIGEYKTDTAETLILRFPKKKQEITDKVKGALGTRLRYIEWWTKDYLFYVMDNCVLGKFKNPHWNYDGKEKRMDENGQTYEVDIQGSNHFAERKMPYILLSVFNTDEMPCDDTSLIEQAKGLQNMVYKRVNQIDMNADNTNSGMKFSGDYFDEDQARRAQKMLRKGESILVPTGDVNAAVQRDIAPPLPPFVYQSLLDGRTRIMAMFGVQGSSASGVASQDTARGKILAKTSDDSRVGGGITEYLEQVYDQCFNWMVQGIYVYYDEPKAISVLGEMGGREYLSLKSSDLPNRTFTVSVKEGSLIPDDPLTKANQAIDLRAAGAISLADLHKRLGDSDPMRTATNVLLETMNPPALYPDLAGQAPMAPPGAPAPVGGEMNGVPANQAPMPDAGTMDQQVLSSVPMM